MRDITEQLEAERRIINAATAGPWNWTQHGLAPELIGCGGDLETFIYDKEVIEASHSGECGCRSACELELEVSAADAEFISHARTALPIRNKQVEAALAVPFKTIDADTLNWQVDVAGGYNDALNDIRRAIEEAGA